MVRLTINNKAIDVEEGTTALTAAHANGIIIPTLCYHKDLSPVGSCRLCLVEVEGWRGQVAACTLQVNEGMVINTETSSLVASRRTILNLLLQNYHDAGYPSSQIDNEFMHWVKVYGASHPDGDFVQPRYPIDSDDNPFIWVDFNKCILCTRCVRACEEVQGRFVWGVGWRGNSTRIISGADTKLMEARCESCGACVAYCPTGTLDNRISMGHAEADKIIKTTCSYCGVGCQFNLHIKDDRVFKVTSFPEAPVNGMSLCVKGRYGYSYIHHHERLLRPRVRKYLLEKWEKPISISQDNTLDSTWIEVDWDTALNLTAQKLSMTRDTFGSDSIGLLTSAKCLNEENYLMNKFARQVIGTNNIDHCARL